MFRRLLLYVNKLFDFDAQVAAITDIRNKPQIELNVVLKSVFAMIATRRGSLNSMELELRLPKLMPDLPSADTISRLLSDIDSMELRYWHWHNCSRLKRNKVIESKLPLNAVAVDGHEFFSH
jgi:hypothetical protein